MRGLWKEMPFIQEETSDRTRTKKSGHLPRPTGVERTEKKGDQTRDTF